MLLFFLITGYLIGSGPMTLQKIETKMNGVAFSNLCGKEPSDIFMFRGAINLFGEMFEEHPKPMTWTQIIDLGKTAIPPTHEGFRKQVGSLIDMIATMGKAYAKEHQRSVTDAAIQAQVLAAAQKGLKAGAKRAAATHRHDCPPSFEIR